MARRRAVALGQELLGRTVRSAGRDCRLLRIALALPRATGSTQWHACGLFHPSGFFGALRDEVPLHLGRHGADHGHQRAWEAILKRPRAFHRIQVHALLGDQSQDCHPLQPRASEPGQCTHHERIPCLHVCKGLGRDSPRVSWAWNGRREGWGEAKRVAKRNPCT